ncbi:MAG TPA: SAM-dependent methyltransferase [Streptosporangiaceae bacterium]|nr:SAM-dependent methyltransferase [Streptosporangiaceae bacterium]
MTSDDPKAPNVLPEPPGDGWCTAFRPDIPSSGRIYGYFLGGEYNYPPDEAAGDQITAHLPKIRKAA